MKYHTDRLTTSGVLGTAASLLVSHLLSFGSIALLLGVPLYFLQLSLDMPTVLRSGRVTANYWGWLGVITLVSQVLCSMVMYLTYQLMRGRSPSLGLVLRKSLGAAPAGLGAALLVGLVIAAGTVFLFVPGYIAGATFSVAVPAAVVEHLSPVDALNRSAALTKGHRWRLFGIILIIGLLSMLGIVATIALLRDASAATFALVYSIVLLSFQLWQSISVSVAYHHLRVLKEGVDLEQLAAAFD
jgi:hypothetical protein